MRFLLGLLLIPFSVHATEWGDLVTGVPYKIDQAFQLPMTGPLASSMDFSVGDEVQYKYNLAIPGFSTVIYVFDYKNCAGPKMETDFLYLPVQVTSPVVNVGAQFGPDCELNLFIEAQDTYTKSILK